MEITEVRSPIAFAHLPRPRHLKALTSVRFFAALYVACYHMVRPFSLWGPFRGFFGAGYSAVSFFFLLSGFILTYAHAGEYELGLGNAQRFWVARFARVYPVYLLSMLFALVLGLDVFRNPIHGFAYLADLLMVQAWSVRMVSFFNVPAWSLSVEAFFYFVFPFLILRMRPRTARRAMWAVAGLWLLAMLPPLLMLHLYPGAEATWHEGGAYRGGIWIFRVRRQPLLLLPLFAAGISLGWMQVRFPLKKIAALIATIVGGVSVLAALLLADHLPFAMLHNGLLLPLYALLLLGLSEDHFLTRMLSVKLLVVLGEASYALYLAHFLFNGWVQTSFGWTPDLLGLVERLAILIPLSIALHFWVERPGRRWILAKWKRRQERAKAV